jgi:hypothetical protein
MATGDTLSGVQDTPHASLAKRAVAWIVLIFAALVLLKLVTAVVFGVLQAIFMIALVVLAGFGVLRALRHV